MMEGKGEVKYTNGDLYRGYFLAGKKHGEGMYQRENGQKMKGTWENDKKNGEFEEYVGMSLMKGKYLNDEKDGMFSIQKKGSEPERQRWQRGKRLKI